MQYFTAADGTRLAYRDEGTGPALICLAGLTRNSTDFTYLMPHLPGLRVIRPDYRGRGAGCCWKARNSPMKTALRRSGRPSGIFMPLADCTPTRPSARRRWRGSPRM